MTGSDKMHHKNGESFCWVTSIGPNSQRPNPPTGNCPNGKWPKNVARSKLPAPNETKRKMPEIAFYLLLIIIAIFQIYFA
jgi:hypothetical protein